MFVWSSTRYPRAIIWLAGAWVWRWVILRPWRLWPSSKRIWTRASSGPYRTQPSLHSRVIKLESQTQRYGMVIKKMGDEALREFVTNLSSVIVANAKRGRIA